MSDIQRVRRNLVSKFIGEFVVRLLGALAFFVLARYMGAGTFGSYLSAWAFACVFVVVHEAGFHILLTREIARHPGQAVDLSLKVGRLKAVTALLVCILAPVMAFVSGMDRHMVLLVGLASLAVNIASFVEMMGAILQGLERMGTEAVVRTLHKLFLIAIPLGAWFIFKRTGYVLLGQAVASLLVLVIAGYFLLRMVIGGKFGRISRDAGVNRNWLHDVWPITLAALFSTLASRVDLVFLSRLRSMEDAGIYGASSRLLEFAQVFPALLVGVLFPVLSRMTVENDGERRDRTYSRLVRWFFALAVPVALVQFIWAPGIIRICYGEGYGDSIAVLRVLAPAMGFSFMSYLFVNGLIASDRQKAYLLVTSAGCLMNVLVNLWAIPRFGPVGSAWARVAGEGVFFLVGFILFTRHVRAVSAGMVFRLAVPCIITLGFVYAFRGGVVGATLSAFLFFPMLWMTGGLELGDIHFAKKMLRAKGGN